MFLGCLDVSTLWWLALFIEALGLSPNNEREGHQQLAILKGNIYYKLSGPKVDVGCQKH